MSNEAPQTQQLPEELLAVTDLDHFIALLTDWHNRQVATVKHLREVPTGMQMIIGDGEDAKEMKLEGERLEGFQLGLDLALNFLGTLPFMAEYVDDAPTQH